MSRTQSFSARSYGIFFAICFAIAIGMTPSGAHAAADGDSSALSELLDRYERTGETETCLNVRRIDQIRVIDDTHLLVRAGVNRFYLNEATAGCKGAKRGGYRLQYTTPNGRLCRGEIIRVVDNVNGIFVGSCSVGTFEKLEKIVEPEEGADDAASR